MDLIHSPFPAWLLIVAWDVLLGMLILALCRGGTRDVLDNTCRHVYLAALVGVLLLWQLRAQTPLGPALHVLGATLLLLMVGWRAAVVGLCAVLIGHTANGSGDWAAFGINGLAMVGLPVLISQLTLRVVERRFPGQPFAYILLCGFAGAGLAMVACLAMTSALLLGFTALDTDHLLAQFTLTGVLLVFPEAFLTGALVACLCMFHPQALRTWTPPWERGPKRSEG